MKRLHLGTDSPPLPPPPAHPVDLDLAQVLGNMPRKGFKLQTTKELLISLSLPEDLTLQEALDRVLRLPAVASKRYQLFFSIVL